MKKVYMICVVLLVSAQWGLGQTYTAIFSGNWSDNSIWGPSGMPSNPCSNCNITINDGVSVTLDISFKMLANSKLKIGSAGAFASSLIIPATNTTSISTGHNIILSQQSGGNPNVQIVSALSSLAFTQGPGTSGTYDGVFIQNPNDFVYFKVLGVQPLIVGTDGTTTSVPFEPKYKQSLPSAEFPAPFTLNSDGTLPVALVYFNGVLNNKVIYLSWSTAMETNSDHFDVERSRDASQWQGIGTVAAKGFSSSEADYSFTDGSPYGGVNYYRLKMVDKDGKFKYSPVAAVRGSFTKGFGIFPNPANSFVNISFGSDINGHMNIRMINQSGQLLLQKDIKQANNITVSLPVSNYPQGIYMVRLTGDDGKSQTLRFVITR